jgi:hypothetical protein
MTDITVHDHTLETDTNHIAPDTVHDLNNGSLPGSVILDCTSVAGGLYD